MKQLKDLMAAATYRRFSSEQVVNDWLDEQRVTDPTMRIAAKMSLEASGKFTPGRRLTAAGGDSPRVLDPRNEIDRLARRAGVRDHQGYTVDQLDTLLEQTPFGPTEKIAIKHRLEELAMLR
jgi:hypothetical protein